MVKKTFKILIVDDNPDNIHAVGSMLNETNLYTIGVAMDGKQALDIMKKAGNYDLVLLDVKMPFLNGLETCKAMRENDFLREIPVIFLTAFHESEEIVAGFEAGGQDYVTKPFNSRELLSRVKTQLELKSSRDRLKLLLSEKEKLISELNESLANVKTLKALLPMCSYCKKIRDDKGYWNQVDEYITNHSDTKFSHGLCPDCLRKQYPDMADEVLEAVGQHEKAQK